jgi:hypothetical protein
MSVLPRSKRDWLTPPEAAEIAQVSSVTIITWCKDNPKLGRKIGARWRVNKDTLNRFLKGEGDGKKR